MENRRINESFILPMSTTGLGLAQKGLIFFYFLEDTFAPRLKTRTKTKTFNSDVLNNLCLEQLSGCSLSLEEN